jgi:hypothetical protein
MLGAQHGYVAILYDLLAATPILLTIGVFIAARYGAVARYRFRQLSGACSSYRRSGA